MQTEKPRAFIVFDMWLEKRKLKWKKGINRKELWKEFVKECGENVFQCKDYNALQKKLGLKYIDEEGYTVDGPFAYKEVTIQEILGENDDK